MFSLKKNLILSLLTSVSRLFSGAVVFIAFARLLSVSDYGKLNFGISFAFLVVAVSEFGYSLMALKDIPQQIFKLEQYVFNSMLQKIAMSGITFLVGIIYIFSTQSDLNIKVGVIFLVFGILFSFVSYYISVFRARNFYIYESFLSFVYTGMLFIVVIVAYFIALDIITISILFCVIRGIQLVASVLLYSIKVRECKKVSIDNTIQKYLLRNSWVFGIHYIMGIAYMNIDTQILTIYSGDKSVGLYQAVFRVISIFFIVSDVVVNVYLPYLASIFHIDRLKDAQNISSLLIKYLFFIGCTAFIFVISFSSELITLLYGEKFLPALVIVPWLGVVLIFRMFGGIYGTLLTISNNQKERVLGIGISLCVSLLLNLLLIPRFGIWGAAVASVVTHVVLHLFYFIFVYRIFKNWLFSKKNIVSLFAAIAIGYSVSSFGSDSLVFKSVTFALWVVVGSAITISLKELKTLGSHI